MTFGKKEAAEERLRFPNLMNNVPSGATRLEALQLAHLEAFQAWQKAHMRFGMTSPHDPELKAAAAALKLAQDAFAAERDKPENKSAAAEMARRVKAIIADERKS